jgi:hypothetical protein
VKSAKVAMAHKRARIPLPLQLDAILATEYTLAKKVRGQILLKTLAMTLGPAFSHLV